MLAFRYTPDQTARATRPDATRGRDWFYIKMCSHLRLTYQLRLAAFTAIERSDKVRVIVRRDATLSEELRLFAEEHSAHFAIDRAPELKKQGR